MDLGAYSQIDELDLIAKKNGINCPRLRGYRLMKSEVEITRSEVKRIQKENEVDICTMLCDASPFWNPASHTSEFSEWTTLLEDYYCPKDSNGDRHIAWERIHGWKRKVLKREIKKQNKAIENQFALFNRYAGRNDVLYIHSRIGGGNWEYYFKDVVHQPWYITKIDDWYDPTYCDIYARIEAV